MGKLLPKYGKVQYGQPWSTIKLGGERPFATSYFLLFWTCLDRNQQPGHIWSMQVDFQWLLPCAIRSTWRRNPETDAGFAATRWAHLHVTAMNRPNAKASETWVSFAFFFLVRGRDSDQPTDGSKHSLDESATDLAVAQSGGVKSEICGLCMTLTLWRKKGLSDFKCINV